MGVWQQAKVSLPKSSIFCFFGVTRFNLAEHLIGIIHVTVAVHRSIGLNFLIFPSFYSVSVYLSHFLTDLRNFFRDASVAYILSFHAYCT